MSLTVIPTDWTAESLNRLFVTVCVNAGVAAKECGLAHITSSQQGDGKRRAVRETRGDGWTDADLRGAERDVQQR